MRAFVNATVYDGSGAEPYRGTVVTDGDRVVTADPAVPPPAAEIVDCAGLALAPGFLDLHSHSDLQAIDPHRLEKIKQGVTAEVVGNCGFSPFPVDGRADEVRGFARGILHEPGDWGFDSARDYLDAARRNGGQTDVYPLLGHGTLRVAVAGARQSITPEERGEMLRLLDAALDGGSAGFSTGLMYAPGSGADAAELVPLLKRVAARDRLYATHMRSYADGLVDAVHEQIDLARESGVRLQISHLQAAGRANWPLLAQAIEAIEGARRDGIDIEFDIYPYQCGSTVLTQWVPRWSMDGGLPALCARLADPADRARIRHHVETATPQSFEDITISAVATEANAHLVGQNLAEIARDRKTGPAEAMLDLLQEERGAVNTVAFNQSEENLRAVITHPLCSVISDGFYVNGRPHPRLHGTFPELLGRIVREKRWLTLPEAIHKITTKPAVRINSADGFVIRPGARADLVLFDPDKIGSPATYDDPQRDPTGIIAVYRAGKRAAFA